MDWKLFLSTFALIFLAELGDKTQLASMAVSAGAKSPWSVFAGASVALVLSTLVAILLGSVIQRLVPEKVIKLSAAILFFLFGAILLFSSLSSADKEKKVRLMDSKSGLLVKLVLQIAGAFEVETIKNYQNLAKETSEPKLKQLFEKLSEAEKQHLKNIKSLRKAHGKTIIPLNNQHILTRSDYQMDNIKLSTFRDILAHEEATAAFYHELARTSHLPSLKMVFQNLALEEESHIQILKQSGLS